MIVHCQREGLLAACQLVGMAASTRTTQDILYNIKAIADADRLTLLATDREVGIRYEVAGVRVEQTGEAIIPVDKLVSILRESPENDISIETDERRCRVNTASSEYEMASEDPASFPDIPEFEQQRSLELTAGVIRSMIRRVIFAAAKQDTRFTLTGVLWEVEESTLRLVATDTRRLAVATGALTATDSNLSKGQSHLIPTKTLTLVERTLHDDNEAIKVALRSNDVLFQTERAVIYSRLLEGQYPPYREIIPKKANFKIELPVEGFHSAVRQASIMTDNETKKVVFRFGPGKMTLQSEGATTGRSRVELPISYTGSPVEITFNPHYLVEMLKILDPAEVMVLDLVESRKPALFRCGEDYLYLVMPLGESKTEKKA